MTKKIFGEIKSNEELDFLSSADMQKIDNITISGPIDLDSIKTKSDNITVTSPVNLDDLKTKSDKITVTNPIDLDSVKDKTDDITVTQPINLDNITVTSSVNLDDLKTKSDKITVTQPINLDNLDPSKYVCNMPVASSTDISNLDFTDIYLVACSINKKIPLKSIFDIMELNSKDTDNDGIPDYKDNDDDNDGTLDSDDAFPLDPNEQKDTDGDGIGNNADTDDDNDGVNDSDEAQAGTNPLVQDGNIDSDGDGLTNAQESDASSSTVTDSDNDGNPDVTTSRYTVSLGSSSVSNLTESSLTLNTSDVFKISNSVVNTTGWVIYPSGQNENSSSAIRKTGGSPLNVSGLNFGDYCAKPYVGNVYGSQVCFSMIEDKSGTMFIEDSLFGTSPLQYSKEVLTQIPGLSTYPISTASDGVYLYRLLRPSSSNSYVEKVRLSDSSLVSYRQISLYEYITYDNGNLYVSGSSGAAKIRSSDLTVLNTNNYSLGYRHKVHGTKMYVTAGNFLKVLNTSNLSESASYNFSDQTYDVEYDEVGGKILVLHHNKRFSILQASNMSLISTTSLSSYYNTYGSSYRMTYDSSNIYYSARGDIFKYNKSTGTSTALVSGTNSLDMGVHGMDTYNGKLYVSNTKGNKIYQINTSSGNIERTISWNDSGTGGTSVHLFIIK